MKENHLDSLSERENDVKDGTIFWLTDCPVKIFLLINLGEKKTDWRGSTFYDVGFEPHFGFLELLGDVFGGEKGEKMMNEGGFKNGAIGRRVGK